MCDYSLEAYRSRPARVGERYVTTQFASGSIGFASPADCSTAICVPYDARLQLEGIPEHVQHDLNVGRDEEVVVVRLEAGHYRDGLRFKNGAEIPIYVLRPGVSATLTEALTGMTFPARTVETVV